MAFSDRNQSSVSRRATGGVVALATIALLVVGAASAGAQRAGSEWVVPERRARRPNPVPAGAAAIAAGREVYRKECRSCHGGTGRGDGPKAAELDTRVSDITSAKVQGQTDGALFWKITEGRGDMPSTRTALSDEQRWMVVHYMRSLAPRRTSTQPSSPDSRSLAARRPPAGVERNFATTSVPDTRSPAPRRPAADVEKDSAAISVPVVLVPSAVGASAQDSIETERLRAEIAALRADLEASQDEFDASLAALNDSIRMSRPGTTRFLLVGYASSAYRTVRNGPSVFTASVSPILLWQLNERILFAAEPSFAAGEEVDIQLEYAHVSVLAADFLSLGIGKFITPFTTFNERVHPAWINKLPDAPLPYGHGGIAPDAAVGAYARGGIPAGAARVSYAIYAVNAPELMGEGEDAGEVESADAGEERAYGGRLGLFLMPAGLEFGYSYQTSDVVDLQGVDLTLSRQSAAMRGQVNIRFEGVLSKATRGPFEGETPGDPERFLVNNRRVGGYAQIAYRPSLVGSRVARNLDFVGRYDWMNRPDWEGGPLGNDTKRFTAGTSYALTPSMVVKLAIQRASNTMADDIRSVILQVATGF